jgi:hypothetical protein
MVWIRIRNSLYFFFIWGYFTCMGQVKGGQCVLFSVVFTPSPLTITAVFGSYSHFSTFNLPEKNMIVGFFVFNPLWVRSTFC